MLSIWFGGREREQARPRRGRILIISELKIIVSVRVNLCAIKNE